MFAAAIRNQSATNAVVARVTDVALALASNFASPKHAPQSKNPMTMMINVRMCSPKQTARRSCRGRAPVWRSRASHFPEFTPGCARDLEVHLHSKLRGEWNPHGGSRPKEIAQRPGGNEQLVRAGDGHAASGFRAQVRGVVEVVHRRRQGGDIGDVVGSRIIAVEEVEELNERHNLPTLFDLERAHHTEIDLYVRRSAELVHRGLDTVDNRAIIGWIAESVYIHRSGQGDGTASLGLNQRRHLKASGDVHDSRQSEATGDIFSRWTVVAGPERILRIADSIDVVPELAKNAAPGLCAGQHVVCCQVEAPRDVALHVQHHGVVAGAVV